MATYVVSDLHGQQEAFNQMLELIDFKYDGTDELHILGDITDWGPDPIPLLKQIKEMSEKYPFVISYKGNHELLFLGAIEDDDPHQLSLTVLYDNGGQVTMTQFLYEEEQTQIDLVEFMFNLKLYESSLTVNGTGYYLSHAGPISEGMDEGDALWQRIRLYQNPMMFMPEEHRHKVFIGGHTITSSTKLKGPQPNRNEMIIDLPNQKILIDCGAKVMGKAGYEEYRLGCLRLDDMAEFYVSI